MADPGSLGHWLDIPDNVKNTPYLSNLPRLESVISIHQFHDLWEVNKTFNCLLFCLQSGDSVFLSSWWRLIFNNGTGTWFFFSCFPVNRSGWELGKLLSLLQDYLELFPILNELCETKDLIIDLHVKEIATTFTIELRSY